MDLTLHHCMLPHTDPEASLAFYRDLLGFDLVLDVGGGAMRWLTLAPPAGGTRIVLAPPAVDPGITDDERRTVLDMMAKGTFAMITLATDDLDGVFARLAQSGVEVVQEPTDQPYGVRDGAVRDPAGTLVRINQR